MNALQSPWRTIQRSAYYKEMSLTTDLLTNDVVDMTRFAGGSLFVPDGVGYVQFYSSIYSDGEFVPVYDGDSIAKLDFTMGKGCYPIPVVIYDVPFLKLMPDVAVDLAIFLKG